MNKLWVRLCLAFSSVVFIAVIIIVGTGLLISQADRFENFDTELEAPGGLLDELAAHYHTHQSWTGAEPILRGARTTFRGERRGGLTILLADSQQKAIFNPRGRPPGQPIGQIPQIKLLPIHDSDQIVGYLGIAPGFSRGPDRPPSSVAPFNFLSGILLTIAAVGGLVGIVFGVLMSRSLTAPLDRLAQTARAIGARNLSQRVQVGGTDEIKEVAHAFNEMAEGLEQAEQLRRNLMADVAHELRTPLTVMQGNLRAILDEVYPLEKAEITRIYDQTRLLNRLVNDLHELAQAEAKQLPLNLIETDLTPLITSINDTFLPIAESNGVTLQTEISENLPQAQIDSARLSQVLHNLLNNGLRHTDTGGEITVRARSEIGNIFLDISDTGEGIPAEHLPFVFDRFYRTDLARSRDKGGAGLGLPIARAIVEAHGGHISVMSEGVAGKGSTFTIQLPANGVKTED